MNEIKKEILDAINQAADWFDIPRSLLYSQVKQESNFDPNAVSHCGAKGLMQIMPVTGYELGLRTEEFFDIEKNLNAGASYLKRQQKGIAAYLGFSSKGSSVSNEIWKMALAAYNGGAGYIFRAITLWRIDNQLISLQPPTHAPGWEEIASLLADKRCVVRGKRPDHKQITDYVSRIWKDYEHISEDSALA